MLYLAIDAIWTMNVVTSTWMGYIKTAILKVACCREKVFRWPHLLRQISDLKERHSRRDPILADAVAELNRLLDDQL